MKNRLLSAAIVVLCVLPFAAAQAVVVTPRKVIYKRIGKNIPRFKRTFEVRYPTFTGKVSLDVRRRLKSATDYWSVFDTKLADNIKDDHWLSSFDYVVKYNKNNILDIWLTMEGVGAYPDGETKYLVFDTRTGNKLGFPDLFVPDRMPELLSKIRGVIKRTESGITDKDVREALDAEREANPEFHPRPDQIEFKHLDFTISDKGVTFFYDYGYPHVVQALEPSGEFFISFAELKPFIRSDGLLARFVR